MADSSLVVLKYSGAPSESRDTLEQRIGAHSLFRTESLFLADSNSFASLITSNTWTIYLSIYLSIYLLSSAGCYENLV